jgi:hypothetical protein
MDNSNIFEYATRNKIRFASLRGEITVEQLWDAPLKSKDDFDLNDIAKRASKALKDATEESFVAVARTTEHTRLEVRFAIVKYVIAAKEAEEAAAKKRAETRVEKEKLLALLAEKQAGKLSKLSEKEIQTRIAALEA